MGRRMEPWKADARDLGFSETFGKAFGEGSAPPLLRTSCVGWLMARKKDHPMILSLESEKTPLVLFHVINTLVLHVCWNKTHKHVVDSTDVFSVRHAILPVRTRKANLQNVPLVGAF